MSKGNTGELTMIQQYSAHISRIKLANGRQHLSCCACAIAQASLPVCAIAHLYALVRAVCAIVQENLSDAPTMDISNIASSSTVISLTALYLYSPVSPPPPFLCWGPDCLLLYCPATAYFSLHRFWQAGGSRLDASQAPKI